MLAMDDDWKDLWCPFLLVSFFLVMIKMRLMAILFSLD